MVDGSQVFPKCTDVVWMYVGQASCGLCVGGGGSGELLRPGCWECLPATAVVWAAAGVLDWYSLYNP